MKIGLTYDLRHDYLQQGYSEEEAAEFDKPETIDAIEAALKELGFATERIGNVKDLVAKLAAGDRWDLVFNIAEGNIRTTIGKFVLTPPGSKSRACRHVGSPGTWEAQTSPPSNFPG